MERTEPRETAAEDMERTEPRETAAEAMERTEPRETAAEGMDSQGRLDLLEGELARRELARRRYGDYLELVYGGAWIPTRFSRFLAEELQAFLEAETGNACDILILETPPQHGKSWTLTEALPSWAMGRNPDLRVILVSYSDESAERFARRNRDKLSLWGPPLFGVKPGGVNRASEFELEGHRGRLISRGVLAGITGHPADLLIIDDPVKNREEADSLTYRNKLWGEWCSSMKSRLSAGAKVILVMTTWHEDDLAARILRTEENVRLLRLPVEAEPSPDCPDPLGREPGEPLCPELGKDRKWLEQFKRAFLKDPQGGQRAWLALYLCRPRTEAGNLVRRDWWKTYDAPPPCTLQLISVDAAFKGGEKNDYVAITVWGRQGQDYYLLDCVNRHLDFVGTLSAIREARAKFPAARTVLIEDKANGSAVLSVLQREMFCVPVEPRGGKAARVHAAAPAIESGHVFLPRSAPWREAFLEQWTAFPAAPHDDMVDSSTQALLYLFDVREAQPVRYGPASAGAALAGAGLYQVYGQTYGQAFGQAFG